MTIPKPVETDIVIKNLDLTSDNNVYDANCLISGKEEPRLISRAVLFNELPCEFVSLDIFQLGNILPVSGIANVQGIDIKQLRVTKYQPYLPHSHQKAEDAEGESDSDTGSSNSDSCSTGSSDSDSD